jgi:Ca2+-transporting ATPase
MTVTAVHLPARAEIGVSGVGYEPVGQFTQGGRPLATEADPDLRALVEAAVLCNDSQLLGPDASDPRWRALGDPTEAALLTLAIKAGVIPAELRARSPRHAEIPFDSAEKMMATQHDGPDGTTVLLKGAPETVVELCAAVRRGSAAQALDEPMRAQVQAAADSMAERALRVLAIAAVPAGVIDGRLGFGAFRGRATLLGLVGQIDPPRPEVAEAVAQCRDAGIRPVMVTGDHKTTGLAVARALGIAREGDLALDGRELAELSEEALAESIDRVSVFARVHPTQKLRIVNAYQRRHDVAAMTGDGVNDAPALVRADVGVAMGITGTDVAKESAEIVVTDDNFATIVAAIEEGRLVYRNIKKIVVLFLATSFAEVAVLLVAMLLGYPPPFAAVQILWNNLVTEGLITVNLAMDPPEGDEMRQSPVPANEPLLTRAMLTRISLMTVAIIVSTLGWFVARLSTGTTFAVAQTETFTLLAVCEWFNVLNCRSERRTVFSPNVFANRWLVGGLVAANVLQFGVVFLPPHNNVFHTVPFGLEQVIAIGAVGSLVLWVEEVRKLVARRTAV